MADSLRPAAQLFIQLFGQQTSTAQNRLSKLWSYVEEGGSFFPLVEKGIPLLVGEYGLDQEEARRFLRRANSLASYVRRRFIEHHVKRDKAGSTGPSSGLMSLVDGPQLERIFDLQLRSKCPSDSLESMFGPSAYLVFLYRLIRDLIESVGDDSKLPLHERRTDLMTLTVDSKAVNAPESSVDVIVRVLQAFIAANTEVPIEQALITARYPNGLPYYQHWVTVDGVAGFSGRSVGDFTNIVDGKFPNFLHSASLTRLAAAALAHASRLGPYQQRLLTEEYTYPEDMYQFYLENFGTEDTEYLNLNQIFYLAQRTNLVAEEVTSLFSVGDYAPRRSDNVEYPEKPDVPEGGRSGSVYINDNAHPAIGITTQSGNNFHRIIVNPNTPRGLNTFDRLNRKLRLDKWLNLSPEQTDALLVAAIRAQARGAEKPEVWAISVNVIHALGLFQRLRERYNCTAADFAVFLDELSLYGRGDALSQFDQVFNNQDNYREPLRLDGTPFALIPTSDQDNLTVSQLCSGLGIDLQTYHYLALAIAQAHDLTDNLVRSSAVISSFYRLVKLSRLLNITPVEGVLMLSVLGGETWLKGLAGKPRIVDVAVDDSRIDVTSGDPGVLSLIEAMQACVQWCEQSNMSVLWMLQHVSAPLRLSDFSQQDQQFFDKIGTLLPSARLSNNSFLVAGIPPAGESDWLDLLSIDSEGLAPVVDVNGLILATAMTPEDYSAFAREKLEWAVRNGLDIEEAQVSVLAEIMLTVLLQARDAQVSLVRESLAVYAGIEGELAVLVLNWVDASVYQLLRQVYDRTDLEPPATQRRRDEPSDPLLELLAVVRQRAEVVSMLGLSAALLQDYLDYGYEAWVDQIIIIDPSQKYVFSVRILYAMTTLTRAFSMSAQPEQKLLDYLRQVHSLPARPSEDALRVVQQAAAIKLAEFFAWSAQEVSECVRHIDPETQVLKTLEQLDLLIRVYQLSMQTGMDARTILRIGTLPETTDASEAYAQAAELALLSQTQTRVPVVQAPGELKQLVRMTCAVEPTEVFASKKDEKAFITMTLTDARGAALKGIAVDWHSELGTIRSGITDPDGVLTAEYFPGTVLGTDSLYFSLSLLEPEWAVSIDVIAHAESMNFPTGLMSPVPTEVVPLGQEITLYATMVDQYGNLGANMLVDWAWEVETDPEERPTIRPAQGFTNQQGQTTVYITSDFSGEFEVGIRSLASGLGTLFEPIRFGVTQGRSHSLEQASTPSASDSGTSSTEQGS
ncbi:Tc toxin subunit A [Pseudomonas sp. ok266]|uniref:Tc toxin subunit A n=1 Tax=Pseudomonas sp. ok266 TaxID=1761896 RepID=UPI0008D88B2A|nr:Tc toxin subunit A [Pseudomonas sp. ok266]SEN49202.1 virulence plasmid A protein [Pseudomonas sp. ok266]